jgi:hypothetical protein
MIYDVDNNKKSHFNNEKATPGLQAILGRKQARTSRNRIREKSSQVLQVTFAVDVIASCRQSVDPISIRLYNKHHYGLVYN